MITFLLLPNGETLEVCLNGDLDIDSTEVIEEELIPSMEEYKKVNVNFTEVPFVDSSGIGLLLSVVNTLCDKGIKITISNVREEVMDVFRILELSDIFGEDVFI